ncbi:putative quinol monooxygenase [Baekduia soli]|nr:putative quinol monooxygenase [Baekduia soli]
MTASSEIVVVATLQVQPGKEDEGRAVLAEVLAPTHAEDGCLGYALHQDVADPTRFVFVERWASEEALGTHRRAPHIKAMGAKFAPIAAAAPDVVITRALPGGDAEKGVL